MKERQLAEDNTTTTTTTMTSVTGKWKLITSNNLENYHNAIHTTDEYKDRLRKLADAWKSDPDSYVEEFNYDASAGTLRRAVFVNGESKRDTKYKVGGEVEATTADGRKAKITLSVEGDSKISIHEKGADFEVNGAVEAKGNDLTLTLTGNSVTSLQTYKRI